MSDVSPHPAQMTSLRRSKNTYVITQPKFKIR